MTKSTRASGLAFQRWIKKWLEEREYQVHNFTPKGKLLFIKGKKVYVSVKNDVFGCDLIAKKPKLKTLWIQATEHKSLKLKQQELLKHAWNLGVDDVQIWIKRETGIIDIYEMKYTVRKPNYQKLKTEEYFRKIGHIIRRKFFQREGVTYAF